LFASTNLNYRHMKQKRPEGDGGSKKVCTASLFLITFSGKRKGRPGRAYDRLGDTG